MYMYRTFTHTQALTRKPLGTQLAKYVLQAHFERVLCLWLPISKYHFKMYSMAIVCI